MSSSLEQQAAQLTLKSASFSNDAIRITTYEDDYTVRGNAFKRNNVVDLAGSTTINFLIDLSAVPLTDGVFVLPVAIQSSEEEVQFRLYEDTDYSGGTPVQLYNVNRLMADSYNLVVTSASTGTDKGTLIRTHAAFGSSTGAAAQNFGTGGGLEITILNPSKNYLIELENLGTGTTRLEYDATVFEIPFS